MIAQKKNLSLDKDATFKQLFRYRNADGTGVDLDGWTSQFYIQERNSAVVVMSIPCDVSEIDGEKGWIQVHIPDEETAFDAKVYAYALELHDPAGDIHRLLYGQLTVRDRSVV